MSVVGVAAEASNALVRFLSFILFFVFFFFIPHFSYSNSYSIYSPIAIFSSPLYTLSLRFSFISTLVSVCFLSIYSLSFPFSFYFLFPCLSLFSMYLYIFILVIITFLVKGGGFLMRRGENRNRRLSF